MNNLILSSILCDIEFSCYISATCQIKTDNICVQNPHQPLTKQRYTPKKNIFTWIHTVYIHNSSCVLFAIISNCPWGLQMSEPLIHNNPPPQNTQSLYDITVCFMTSQGHSPSKICDAKGLICPFFQLYFFYDVVSSNPLFIFFVLHVSQPPSPLLSGLGSGHIFPSLAQPQ